MNLSGVQHLLTQSSTHLNVRISTTVNVRTQLDLATSSSSYTCIDKSEPTHPSLIKLLPDPDANLYSKLLLSYCKSGSLEYARSLFDEMPERDYKAWAVLIGGYARCRRFSEAIVLFREMGHVHKPDGYSISVVLGCCVALRAVNAGREIHGYVIRNMGGNDARCESSLVNFYAKCGLFIEAREVFERMTERDVVSWTIMIMAFANRPGCEDEMLGLFIDMQCSSIEPNQHTLSVVLGCAPLEVGKQLHAQALKRNWESDVFVGSALVDMYAKNEKLNFAHLVFYGIVEKDIVCFNSLISGYGRAQHVKGITCVFEEMGLAGLVPNQSTYVGMLNGCANLGSIHLGKQLHAQVVVSGNGHDVVIQGVLVDMYAKCGSLDAARAAFDRMSGKKSIVAWNSMIGGYGKHGYGEEALRIFKAMEAASVPPDYITFICLLSACSHSGMVEEGWKLFNSMGEVYGIQARNEHYCCMVDIWGRAGMTQRAYEFICRMQCAAGASVWGALLGACRVCGDAKLGEIAARRLFEMEPNCSGSYVALANIFAARGLWDDAVMIRALMDDRGIRKDPGSSWIEIDNQMHVFQAGKTMHHPRIQEIHYTCKRLNSCICGTLL